MVMGVVSIRVLLELPHDVGIVLGIGGVQSHSYCLLWIWLYAWFTNRLVIFYYQLYKQQCSSMLRTLSTLARNFSRKVTRKILPQPDQNNSSVTKQQPTHNIKQVSNIDQDALDEEFLSLDSYKFKEQELPKSVIKQVKRDLAYEGEDRYPQKLVNRMQKGVVWGLGGQLLNLQRKTQKSGIPGSVEDVKEFLELQQTKNIYFHDFGEGKNGIKRYALIATAYSNRHCFKVGTQLRKALNEGKKPNEYDSLFIGRKDDEWVMVEFMDLTVHIMTESERTATDLEWKWNNPVSEEIVERYEKMSNMKSRGMFEPFE